ncbi:hypothetical protein RO3G_17305 [Rhizopus delemar RA 99-880]|uniref:Uncharacterized protein n=1 Tax=Rhizopus delemar (strain RA 99-880 / ATCC MYA-4621 / FGSC 9543 / NRRL 43880) TaxID=246409 RepID=I1CVW4_RHIO9|nr:hypothetical protein RO3G_17305 [Rhizopus delemar RA 99-880]|eukprot:EIE92594.1 hypothetical protein RO3G_17305 [Rhizopus delemar RA 99-880]
MKKLNSISVFFVGLFPSIVERPISSFFIFEGKKRKSKVLSDYFAQKNTY